MSMSADCGTDYLEPECVSTTVFTVGQGKFAMRMASLHMRWFGVACLFAVVVCGFLAVIFDVRWFVVALMAVLFLIPLLWAFQYLNHGLRRFSAINSLPHRLVFSPIGITVCVNRRPDPEEAETDAEGMEESGDGDSGDSGEWVGITLPYSRIGNKTVTRGFMHLSVVEPDEGFLMVPEHAFGNVGDIRRAVAMLGFHKDDDMAGDTAR